MIYPFGELIHISADARLIVGHRKGTWPGLRASWRTGEVSEPGIVTIPGNSACQSSPSSTFSPPLCVFARAFPFWTELDYQDPQLINE